ncbi:glycerol-3-phosphate dehydrogenase [Sphingorhabdus lutea]|uniref:Glycerol-3-phosphate dehydrogenase n=1 Tax=Sphingorhabdus lutea TaxID=1913578 RepID=A0A1L3JEA1_9SPHN|nr:glycerol-3-phosphate dehydrogenase [Sphingorhabdus lutea]APG63454.1 glycerol-3-phosphate dehydrogenase [Sphingorhabdus lutea]
MNEKIYDIAIIGGGINGTGIARDAAGRGANILLLEKGDLASGTSSASTKLIHGGLRYLEHYEFALVREALSERERLWAIAPHIIHPMRFILPYRKGLRPAWLLRLGLFIYDHLGGRKKLPATQSVNLHKHPAGQAIDDMFVKGFEYSDCWVDDARLVVLNARDAANNGADIMPHHNVAKLERDGKFWRITANENGKEHIFCAKSIINAAGPSVANLHKLSGEHSNLGIRLVRGSHIIVPKIFDHDYAYFFQNPDGRIFFAIPYEDDFTLIGTTDQDHEGTLDEIKASDEEIAYMCTSASDYFKIPVRQEDVIWTYSGVRPLIDDGSGRPESATRGYSFECDGGGDNAPILSIFGGKITSYRHLAEEALDRMAAHLPRMKTGKWTSTKPLPGGNFPTDGRAALVQNWAAAHPWAQQSWLKRWARSYGTLAENWLSNAVSQSDLGQDFGHGLYAAEVDYLIDQEWARHSDDILWRRTKLGLRLTPEQVKNLQNYVEKRIMT